jgi:hypothetical protein
MFCVVCLEIYGYPTTAYSPDVLQAVTVKNGSALCEMHWNNIFVIEGQT